MATMWATTLNINYIQLWVFLSLLCTDSAHTATEIKTKKQWFIHKTSLIAATKVDRLAYLNLITLVAPTTLVDYTTLIELRQFIIYPFYTGGFRTKLVQEGVPLPKDSVVRQKNYPT